MNGTHYHCSEKTQQKLMQAVMRLAQEKSYETITVQDICTAAGVSTGSFYHQFRSKDELVHEAYQNVDWLLTEEFVAESSQLPPVAALDRLLRLYLTYVQDNVGLIIAQYYQVLLKNPNIPRYNANRPYCQEIQRLLTQAMEEGAVSRRYEMEYLTWSVMRLMRGLIFDWVIQGGTYNLLERYSLDFGVLIRGLAPAPGEQ